MRARAREHRIPKRPTLRISLMGNTSIIAHFTFSPFPCCWIEASAISLPLGTLLVCGGMHPRPLGLRSRRFYATSQQEIVFGDATVTTNTTFERQLLPREGWRCHWFPLRCNHQGVIGVFALSEILLHTAQCSSHLSSVPSRRGRVPVAPKSSHAIVKISMLSYLTNPNSCSPDL